MKARDACKFLSSLSLAILGISGNVSAQQIPSGTYQALSVVCFTPGGGGVTTALANINGNVTIELLDTELAYRVTGENCSATARYRIAISPEQDGVGIISAAGGQVTTSTNQSCTTEFFLVPVSGGTISPSAIIGVAEPNSQVPGFETGYVTVPESGLLGLDEGFQVQGSPNDICLTVYEQQR